MGPKKGKKGKGKGNEDEENPTENFFGLYKRCCKEFETVPSATLLNKTESVLMKEKTYRKFSLMKRSENSMQEHFVRLFRTQQKTQKV